MFIWPSQRSTLRLLEIQTPDGLIKKTVDQPSNRKKCNPASTEAEEGRKGIEK
jgi:hypothetical protein